MEKSADRRSIWIRAHILGVVGCALGFGLIAGLLEPQRGAAAKEPERAKGHEIKELRMVFVRIEPGEFLMGSPADEANRDEDEDAHRLRITKAFLLQTTEVTQAQWKAVMGQPESYFKGDDLPVDNVSWEDAVEFCKKLGQREGRNFRLPTEAEWEYAARSGKQ